MVESVQEYKMHAQSKENHCSTKSMHIVVIKTEMTTAV